jgi:nucleotide-binding universal stress UspA family protein
MAAQKILLAYNFSTSDRKAMEFAVRNFADRPDTEITVFHAYTPLPSIEVSGESITGKLKESFSYLNQKISELEEALQAVRAELVQRGFTETRVKSIFKPRRKDIAGEIMEVSNEIHFDIVILNRKPGRVARFFSGSVHAKVLSAMRNTVLCIVS